MISNKLYDILKWFCQIVIPGFATLYYALAGIWIFPYPSEIVGTLMAVASFLGAIIGLNAASYDLRKRAEEIELAIEHSWKDELSETSSDEVFLNQLPEQVYLALKWLTITVFPALATLYAAVALLWALPYSSEIVGTIAALTTFMGLLLGISSIKIKTQPAEINPDSQ